jgi:hypothetical protein
VEDSAVRRLLASGTGAPHAGCRAVRNERCRGMLLVLGCNENALLRMKWRSHRGRKQLHVPHTCRSSWSQFSCEQSPQHGHGSRLRHPLHRGYFRCICWSPGALNLQLHVIPGYEVELGQRRLNLRMRSLQEDELHLPTRMVSARRYIDLDQDIRHWILKVAVVSVGS